MNGDTKFVILSACELGGGAPNHENSESAADGATRSFRLVASRRVTCSRSPTIRRRGGLELSFPGLLLVVDDAAIGHLALAYFSERRRRPQTSLLRREARGDATLALPPRRRYRWASFPARRLDSSSASRRAEIGDAGVRSAPLRSAGPAFSFPLPPPPHQPTDATPKSNRSRFIDECARPRPSMDEASPRSAIFTTKTRVASRRKHAVYRLERSLKFTFIIVLGRSLERMME